MRALDRRGGACALRPGVEDRARETRPRSWRVNGVDRSAAHLVSRIDDRPVYGGTPDDASLIELIREAKRRGLSVGLYPFILMDVPPGNARPDPYGGAEQATFPWRGRITSAADGSNVAADDVAAFFGACAPGDVSAEPDGTGYAGPSDEWSFRRFILHHARLAAVAGGVDAFVLGSELRGLTRLRDASGGYPAVAALRVLAADVRSILAHPTVLTYAADWTEYFGHQPADGSGDVRFHLDPLWADENIDVVGLDWYAPLADWRDRSGHLDALAGFTEHDPAYFAANIEGGEGYDWWYSSAEARAAQAREPITDGALNKPWMFRYKDLRAWWSNHHYERTGGVQAASATAWVPESKPIWFVELGYPAIDKGANQPNVFVDPKSAESVTPYFSNGARDDLVQRRAIEAQLRYWAPEAGRNPTSSVYGGPMLEWDKIHLWTWDARPFPDFPARAEVWGDGGNWRLGHWLTGRLGSAPLATAVEDICGRAGLDGVDVSGLDGLVSGYVLDRPTSARSALEPLAAAFRFVVADRGDGLAFVAKSAAPVAEIAADDLVLDETGSRVRRERAEAVDLPLEARVRFFDDARDYQAGYAYARAGDVRFRPVLDLAAPVPLDRASAERLARAWLADAAAEAESVELTLGPDALGLEAGDVVTCALLGEAAYRIDRLDGGLVRRVSLRRAADVTGLGRAGPEPGVGRPIESPPAPFGLVLDTPLLGAAGERGGPLVAAAADPWPGVVIVEAGPDAASLVEVARLTRPAAVGELVWDLWPGPLWRWDEGNRVRVRLVGAALASSDAAGVFAGANALAVQGVDGDWEVAQFRSAVLVAPDEWEIAGLLRGQAGSETQSLAPAGSRVVLLDGSAAAAPLDDAWRGAPLTWRFSSIGGRSAEPFGAVYVGVDRRPLAPVHVRGERLVEGVRLTWIRRTRLGGDDWAAVEAPLGEAREAYRVEVLDGDSVVWSAATDTPEALFPAAVEASAFADVPRLSLLVRVAQLSQSFGWGRARVTPVYL